MPDWIQPPIMAALIAALAAVGAALLNAHLNRAKDERNERRQAQALAAAFAAEIEVLTRLSHERIVQIDVTLAGKDDDFHAAAITTSALPPGPIWEQNASRVGELPVDLAGKLSLFHTLLVEIEQQCQHWPQIGRTRVTRDELERLARWFSGPARVGDALTPRLRQFASGSPIEPWPKDAELKEYRSRKKHGSEPCSP